MVYDEAISLMDEASRSVLVSESSEKTLSKNLNIINKLSLGVLQILSIEHKSFN